MTEPKPLSEIIGDKRILIKNCPIHGEYESEITNISGRDFFSSCQKCVEAEELAEKEKKHENTEALIKFCEACGIEEEYYNATFENYETGGNPEKEKAVAVFKRIISGERQEVIAIGSHGTGKTRLAACAIKENKGGLITTAYEICIRIKATYGFRSKKTEEEIVKELASKDLKLLVIDEIGRTAGTRYELNWLSWVFDKRHSRGLKTILLSNAHPMSQCPNKGKDCDECFERYVGNDIMSRVKQNCGYVNMTWEDYRSKKKEE